MHSTAQLELRNQLAIEPDPLVQQELVQALQSSLSAELPAD
jgi:hypothetical protein